jgi:hypothetical protein
MQVVSFKIKAVMAVSTQNVRLLQQTYIDLKGLKLQSTFCQHQHHYSHDHKFMTATGLKFLRHTRLFYFEFVAYYHCLSAFVVLKFCAISTQLLGCTVVAKYLRYRKVLLKIKMFCANFYTYLSRLFCCPCFLILWLVRCVLPS